MKISYKLSRIIVLAIAGVLVLLGIAEWKWGLKLNENIGSGLLMVAAIIFFIGKQQNKNDESNDSQEETTVELENEKKNENSDKNEIIETNETEKMQ